MLTADERARLELHLETDAGWQEKRAWLTARITLPRMLERRIAEALERYAIGHNLIRPERLKEIQDSEAMRPLKYPHRPDAGIV